MGNKPELLIPAGSLAELKSYLEAGADAAYEAFNMHLQGRNIWGLPVHTVVMLE